jgi:NAD(P)H-hydrate repair Nnr-like enzyme with NAD(P)H-hydrate dehydratase domain
MSAQSPQNYENHSMTPKSLMVNAVVMLMAGVLAIIGLFAGSPRLAALAAAVTGLGMLSVLMMTRHYALTLQDRIIRLEMQIRLDRVLPDDLKTRMAELTLPQLIGLRFASDAELPDLTRKALDEKLGTADSIKRLVRDWQADHQRV